LNTTSQSFWLEKAWLTDGWCTDVRLQVSPAGEIISVSTGALQSGDEAIPGAIIPGLPNLHSHAFQRAAAGLTEHRHSGGPGSPDTPDSFWTWREVLHGFVTRLNPDDQDAIARQLYLEMLKSGYTAVGEFHYLHKDPSGTAYADPAEMSHRLINAAEHVGIGMTLLPVLYSVGGYRGVEINAGQRRYVLEVEQFIDLISSLYGTLKDKPSLRIGIAPHSVRQVPAEQLFDALNGIQGIDPSMPVHIHAAEQVRDVDEHIATTGARPVEWLLANAPVNEHWCLVHATHVNANEVAGMATANAVAGLCPTTEANLGDGLFPLEDYLAQGGRWGIGSDSHISVSPVEELRWLEYGQRLATLTRNVSAHRGDQGQGGSTAARLCRDALSGGAQALGRAIGALAPGCSADLVVLDTDHPLLYGRRDDRLLDTWVFSGNTPTVRHVMTAGKWVIRDGHHPDEEAIAQNFRKVMTALV
jgi:formimidoylglutamate deiminase